jgi:flagellar biosynthesis/type III secretory pathway M-ring protein FliF/YscJ
MPNHVTTICAISGPESEIKRFRDLMFKFEKENGEEKLCFDFSSVIPMPPELDIECDGWIGEVESKRLSNHTMIKDLLDRLRSHIASHSEDVKKQTIKNFVQGIENYLTHGYLSFYDWRRAHWGTKWNSYSLDDRNFPEFTFETAWAFPIPVFEKLAKEFPALKPDQKDTLYKSIAAATTYERGRDRIQLQYVTTAELNLLKIQSQPLPPKVEKKDIKIDFKWFLIAGGAIVVLLILRRMTSSSSNSENKDEALLRSPELSTEEIKGPSVSAQEMSQAVMQNPGQVAQVLSRWFAEEGA